MTGEGGLPCFIKRRNSGDERSLTDGVPVSCFGSVEDASIIDNRLLRTRIDIHLGKESGKASIPSVVAKRISWHHSPILPTPAPDFITCLIAHVYRRCPFIKLSRAIGNMPVDENIRRSVPLVDQLITYVRKRCLGPVVRDLDIAYYLDSHADPILLSVVNYNPWALLSDKGIARHLQLPERSKGVQEDQSSRNFCPKKLLSILGAALVIGSFYLVSKVLNYVYLNREFRVNLAVAEFFFCLVQFLFGGWLLLWSMGLM